jgi:UDP-glucose 4-epimerase
MTPNLTNKTVVITGGGGFIGSALAKELYQCGANVIRFSSRKLLSEDGIENFQGELTDNSSWMRIVSRADLIFHLAGNTSVYSAEKDPQLSFDTTTLPLDQMFAAIKKLNRKPKVVFASTATVYGLGCNFPIGEDSAANPLSKYEEHKLVAEAKLQRASQEGLHETVSLRLANVYGPSPMVSSSPDRGVLNMMARRALKGDELTIYGTGELIRDYIYIDDVVSAFISAGTCRETNGKIYNVSTGKGNSVLEAVMKIKNCVKHLTGKSLSIHHIPWPPGAHPIEFRNFIGDADLLKKTTGWQSSYDLDAGIEKMLRIFMKEVQNES